MKNLSFIEKTATCLKAFYIQNSPASGTTTLKSYIVAEPLLDRQDSHELRYPTAHNGTKHDQMHMVFSHKLHAPVVSRTCDSIRCRRDTHGSAQIHSGLFSGNSSAVRTAHSIFKSRMQLARFDPSGFPACGALQTNHRAFAVSFPSLPCAQILVRSILSIYVSFSACSDQVTLCKSAVVPLSLE